MPTFFGDPLWIRVKRGEELGDIKERIRATLEIPEEDFKQWRFAYQPRQIEPLEYLEDDEDVVSKFSEGPFFVSRNKKYLGDIVSFLALRHTNTEPHSEPREPTH